MKYNITNHILSNTLNLNIYEYKFELNYIQEICILSTQATNGIKLIKFWENIKDSLSKIDDKNIQTNIYTLLMLNISTNYGFELYPEEISKLFKLNDLFDINKNLFNTYKHPDIDSYMHYLIYTNIDNTNLEQLKFLIKNYTKEELNFSNHIRKYALTNLNKNKEWFIESFNNDLININSIKVDNSFNNNIEFKTILEIVCQNKPSNDEVYNTKELFKLIYSLGGKFDFNKVHKTYQNLYTEINKAYLNLEENLNNLSKLLDNLSNIFKSNDHIDEKDILSKYKIVDQKIKDFDSLITKYKEQIDLGMIQQSYLENIDKNKDNNLNLKGLK